eukprot:6385187-Lingulodinium_polyedra.AAC.1
MQEQKPTSLFRLRAALILGLAAGRASISPNGGGGGALPKTQTRSGPTLAECARACAWATSVTIAHRQ